MVSRAYLNASGFTCPAFRSIWHGSNNGQAPRFWPFSFIRKVLPLFLFVLGFPLILPDNYRLFFILLEFNYRKYLLRPDIRPLRINNLRVYALTKCTQFCCECLPNVRNFSGFCLPNVRRLRLPNVRRMKSAPQG